MITAILPFLLKYWKAILGGLLLVSLYIGYRVLVHQRDAAREQAKAYAAIIEQYKVQTQVQKDKLDAALALALSQQVKVVTETKIQYIQSQMPPQGAPDDAVRQWAIKMGKEMP